VIGASFVRTVGGTVVNTLNYPAIVNSIVSAAGIVTLNSLYNVKSFNILIIDNPTAFQNIDNSSGKILVSSIVNPTITRSNPDVDMPLNIQLFFQVLQKPSITVQNSEYYCVFYDTNSLQWNDSGCTKPTFNSVFNRYQCNCSHLTSFALIWLPQQQNNGTSPQLNAQDIVSLVFQALSITCFLAIVIHATVVRIMDPPKYAQPRNLLPLISCGITMILFVFYIALVSTVYTRNRNAQTNVTNNTSNQNGKSIQVNFRADSPSTTPSPPTSLQCLSNELALTFIVYFLIIFMFCSKTAVGYYNYRHFVQLFPQPDRKNLVITLTISFFVALIWMIFAAGFNSNPSFGMTEVYGGKICWFTRNVIHYFLTIPICLFLLANLIMFVFVAKCIIDHARKGEVDKKKKIQRRRKCMIVLLASCVTQGFGWLFGPLILAASDNMNAVNTLAWLFVIFNGLEGLWAILLYLIVREERIDETPRQRDDRIGRPLDDDNDDDDDQPNPPDDQRFDMELRLKNLASDSPRNSYVDHDEIKLSHRPNREENDK
jgi:hypothetical protein